MEEELENGDMVGVVKIKDGLFICDEFGAQVSQSHSYRLNSSTHYLTVCLFQFKLLAKKISSLN
jgi:hypothetical protein